MCVSGSVCQSICVRRFVSGRVNVNMFEKGHFCEDMCM